MNNRYLEQHVFTHQVMRPDGHTEEVAKDHREELRLTEEGKAKRQELEKLLADCTPYCLSHFLSWFWLNIVCCVLLLLSAMIIGARAVGMDHPSYVIYVFGGLGTMAIYITAQHFLTLMNLRRNSSRIAPNVAQFANENPEFMQALAVIGYHGALAKCDHLVKLHREQEAA